MYTVRRFTIPRRREKGKGDRNPGMARNAPPPPPSCMNTFFCFCCCFRAAVSVAAQQYTRFAHPYSLGYCCSPPTVYCCHVMSIDGFTFLPLPTPPPYTYRYAHVATCTVLTTRAVPPAFPLFVIFVHGPTCDDVQNPQLATSKKLDIKSPFSLAGVRT